MKPKFGVVYSRLHPLIAPAEFARQAEALGYDSVWATEGLVNELPALDPVVARPSVSSPSGTATG